MDSLKFLRIRENINVNIELLINGLTVKQFIGKMFKCKNRGNGNVS